MATERISKAKAEPVKKRGDTMMVRVPTQLRDKWEQERLKVAEIRNKDHYPMTLFLEERYLRGKK